MAGHAVEHSREAHGRGSTGLRVPPSAAMATILCQKTLQILAVKKTDPAVLTVVYDGLRRISELHRLVWDTLESLAADDTTAPSSLIEPRPTPREHRE